jgi:SNF2 family DNA or RNA helicase
MTSNPEILIRVPADLSELTVARGDGVPDLFWRLAVAEWGGSGPGSQSRLTVSVERFLSHLGWVSEACRRHNVGVDLDEPTRSIIERNGSERRALELARTNAFDRADVDARLNGSRFIRPLREFQKRDLARLLALPNGANFSVPGAGKTTVTYALYEAEWRAGRVQRLLVVAPLSAFEAWGDERAECFKRPLPELYEFNGRRIPSSVEVCLVNYQRLASNYRALAEWVAEAPTHVVLDEAHRAKRGWSGEWGRSCLNLAFLAARRDILTGTPAPQGYKDLEALLDFAWPGQARAILPKNLFSRGTTLNIAEEVADSIGPLFVRTTKKDLDLPGVDFQATILPLTGLQRDIYQALRNAYAGQLTLSRRDRFDFARMGQVVMYLLEAATNPQLLSAGSSEFDPPEFKHPPLSVSTENDLKELLARYAQYETPPKFIELGRIVKANAELGRKTLVWTNFVRNVTTLERMLRRYSPAVVHGGVPSRITAPNAPRKREDEVSRFRSDDNCQVLLANPAAMSEGVSLHLECHDAVYLDRTFNAGQYLQSLDRIHRLGLKPTDETRITFLLTDETVDQTVDDRIRAKADRLGRVLSDDAISELALPDDEDYGAPVDSVEDIAALLAHLRGDGGAASKK